LRSVENLRQKLGEDHAWQLDLEDEQAVVELLQKVQPSGIIHLAARPSVNESFTHAWLVLKTNVHLQLVMLEAMRVAAPQARLLSIGSAQEYGTVPAEYREKPLPETTPLQPNNPYAISKVTAEHLAQTYHQSYGLDVIQARPFNQIGPGQASAFAVASFAQQIVKIEQGEQQQLLVGNLAAIRDFTDVRDAAAAYEVLLQTGESGQVYNLGSGNGVSMQSLLDTLIELSTAQVQVEVDPQRLRPSDTPYFVADNTKIAALGWTPRYPLQQTLTDILEYERQQKEKTS